MLHPLRNFVALAKVTWPFLRVYRSQFSFRKERGPIYQFWKHTADQIPDLDSLPGSLKRRIAHYLHANTITAQWFSILHGKKLNDQEQKAGWYLAIATPIADYLVDEESLSLSQMEGILDGSFQHPFGELSRQLYQRAKNFNANQQHFDTFLKCTLQAQEASLQQSTEVVSHASLKKITWDKGGYALLLYRTALNVTLSASEEQAIYQLGGLMQLHNDIFDLHRDFSENITTIPSTILDVEDLRKLFENEIESTLEQFRHLGKDRISRHQFLLLLHLAVGTGLICLDQYQDLQNKYGQFRPSELTRDELICDMEKFDKISRNLLQTLIKNYDQ